MQSVFVWIVAMMVITGVAAAQSYPTKPVRFIVPFPPGGGADVIGRVLSQKLTDKWGRQVVIDNRAATLEALAAQLGMDAGVLTRTVNASNVAVAAPRA